MAKRRRSGPKRILRSRPIRPKWTPEGRPERRVGIFFGVANYHFNPEGEAVRAPLNLGVCHEDAKQLAETLREVGQLSEYRVYTNEQATKENLKQAITKWLPQVSRAGDTVVIFFSGHGGQIPDDNKDEADGKDEILLPYDFIDLRVVAGMKELDKQGRLDPSYKPILETGIKLAQKLGTEAADEKLSRATGVSDDLFGHWLQAVDGRQVVVVLDVCHAGGFAEGDKGNSKDLGAAKFDF